jgi:hypothetical protein
MVLCRVSLFSISGSHQFAFLVSGTRAAKEVADSMIISVNNEGPDYDRLIPMSMFRYLNPKRECRCCFCHQAGTTVREGKLLAFKKGSRQIL